MPDKLGTCVIHMNGIDPYDHSRFTQELIHGEFDQSTHEMYDRHIKKQMQGSSFAFYKIFKINFDTLEVISLLSYEAPVKTRIEINPKAKKTGVTKKNNSILGSATFETQPFQWVSLESPAPTSVEMGAIG